MYNQSYAPSELVVRPVDKKDHYIKRCVAIAGDKFEIKDHQIYINDKPEANPEKMQFMYAIKGECQHRKIS